MKGKLILSVALLFTINNAQGNMECFLGPKIIGFPMNLPTAESVTCSNMETCMVFTMRSRMQVPGLKAIELIVKVGKCIDPSICSSANCSFIMAELRNMSMPISIVQCSKTCDIPESAEATPAQMPVLPNNGGGVPAEMPVIPEDGPFPAQMPVTEENERVCNLPVWNMAVEDNKILSNSKPRFTLKVAGAGKKGYKPGRSYKIIITAKKRKSLKITGFIATLYNVNSSSCGLGSFIGSRRRYIYAPRVDYMCDQPLIMDPPMGTEGITKSRDSMWRAPQCDQPGPVEIKVAVRGSDNHLYRDNEGLTRSDWELSTILYPKLKKKRPRRPNRNGGKKKKNKRRQ